MEDNSRFEHETEANLGKLLLDTCLKWRIILLISLVSALALGGLKLALNIISLNDPKTKNNDYQTALELHEAKGRQLEASIEKCENKLKAQTDYIENSLLMKLDPYNEWNGTLSLYVDTDHQVIPGSSIQNDNPAYRIVYAYSDYATSGEFYNTLSENLSFDIAGAKYLKETLTVSAYGDRYALTISAVADTEDHCTEILNAAKELLYKQQRQIGSQLGTHDLEASNTAVYSQINAERIEEQKRQSENAALLQSELSDFYAEYQTWKEEGKKLAPPTTNARQTVLNAVKFAVIAGFVAALLMFVLFCVVYIMSDRVQSPEDFPSGLLLLGEIPPTPGKRTNPLDKLFCQMFGVTARRDERDSRLEAGALYIGRLAERLPHFPHEDKKKIAFISDMPEKELQSLVKTLDKLSASQYSAVAAGNILVSPEAGRLTASASAAVLVAKQGISVKKSMENMIKQLNASEKKLLGVLVTDINAK